MTFFIVTTIMTMMVDPGLLLMLLRIQFPLSWHAVNLFKLIKQPHETYESMGSSTSYYLSVYDQNEDKPWFLSWNWVAFFTAFWGAEIFWLLYRRMYLFAILIGFLGHGLFEIFTLKLTLFANDAGGPLFAKCVQWIFKLIFIY